MFSFFGGLVLGAVIILLVAKNNPKLAAWIYKGFDKIEEVIEEKTGKDI